MGFFEEGNTPQCDVGGGVRDWSISCRNYWFLESLFDKKVKFEEIEEIKPGHAVIIKKDGTILMFAEDDKQGGYQFTKETKDNWKKKQFGKANSPFKSKSKNSSKLLVMTNPFQYIQENKKSKSFLEQSAPV